MVGLQDADGCRLSHVGETWLFEAAGLPAVRGDQTGLTLEPCPGVCLELLHKMVLCATTG